MTKKPAHLFLNVFHLTPFLNNVFKCFNLGGFHSQVSIDDQDEVYFGFSNLSGTGIRHNDNNIGKPPPALANIPFFHKFDLGEALYTLTECQIIVSEMENNPDWLAEHYHIFNRNCNTFSMHLCKKLLDYNAFNQNYPFWISKGEKAFGRFVYQISFSYIVSIVNSKHNILVFGSPVGDDEYQHIMEENGIEHSTSGEVELKRATSEVRYDLDSENFEANHESRALAPEW